MALNFNIPMPLSPMESFKQGFGLTDNLMNQILNRKKVAQEEEHFQEQLKLHKAAAGRASQAAADAHKLALMKMDPMHAMNQLKTQIEYLQGLKQGGLGGQNLQGQNPTIGSPVNEDKNILSNILSQRQENPEVQAPMRLPQENQQNIDEGQVGQEQPLTGQGQNKNLLPGGIDPDDIIRGLTYKAFGLKVPATKSGRMAEPPEIKAQRDYEYKLKEKKYDHELKMADEATKIQLKNQQERHKVIQDAKNDIPHLETSLRSLKIMKKIADDPKNDDMFGHWWLGNDKAAQRISNPNAGVWQTEGLGPIVDAEMKMSSRGNVVALKAAQANKPNFGEKRTVAASKIDSRIKQLEDQLKKTKDISNSGSHDDFGKMSEEELRAIIGGE